MVQWERGEKKGKGKERRTIKEMKDNQQFSDLTKRGVAAVNGSALREVGVLSYSG